VPYQHRAVFILIEIETYAGVVWPEHLLDIAALEICPDKIAARYCRGETVRL
jgi:hypothetical protein